MEEIHKLVDGGSSICCHFITIYLNWPEKWKIWQRSKDMLSVQRQLREFSAIQASSQSSTRQVYNFTFKGFAYLSFVISVDGCTHIDGRGGMEVDWIVTIFNFDIFLRLGGIFMED